MNIAILLYVVENYELINLMNSECREIALVPYCYGSNIASSYMYMYFEKLDRGSTEVHSTFDLFFPHQ